MNDTSSVTEDFIFNYKGTYKYQLLNVSQVASFVSQNLIQIWWVMCSTAILDQDISVILWHAKQYY